MFGGVGASGSGWFSQPSQSAKKSSSFGSQQASGSSATQQAGGYTNSYINDLSVAANGPTLEMIKASAERAGDEARKKVIHSHVIQEEMRMGRSHADAVKEADRKKATWHLGRYHTSHDSAGLGGGRRGGGDNQDSWGNRWDSRANSGPFDSPFSRR